MMGLIAGLMANGGGRAEAQAVPTGSGKLGPADPVTYANKWELYGGVNFMNFQAGRALPKRMNLGGTEGSITYWLNKKVGLTADYRWDGGTTPVLANPYVNRPFVFLRSGNVWGAIPRAEEPICRDKLPRLRRDCIWSV